MSLKTVGIRLHGRICRRSLTRVMLVLRITGTIAIILDLLR